SFKNSIVKPYYKGKGKRNHPGSYRPICNLPIMGKIFEKIIYFRLYTAVEPGLDKCQYGFRKKRSCMLATAKFSNDLYRMIDGPNQKAVAVFIDLRKAFNSVNHNLLMKKLIENFEAE